MADAKENFRTSTKPGPKLSDFIKQTAPGSEAALALGCTCPVLDNHHGHGRPDGTYWMVEGCPVHKGGE